MGSDSREVVRTGRKNKLGDELVATPGVSDWGEKGWFVAVEMHKDNPDRPTFITPRFFFSEPGARERAIKSAREDDHLGF